MAEDPSPASNVLPLIDAARAMKVSTLAVRGLIDAGYLKEEDGGVALVELKSFIARNADGGAGNTLGAAAESTDPQGLMDALDQRTDELAQLAYDRFVRVIPDARSWSPEQRETFIEQAKGRFGAILAVMSQGTQVDQALRHDLEEVGASAAWAGTSLPHLLLVLRISRDLLLQSALRMADQKSGRLNAALGAFSARMMPSIDRLTDALADGFWNAKLDQQQEEWHRLASVIEGSSYGVYEADLDGIVQYTNPTFGHMLGVEDSTSLLGRPLNEVLRASDGSPVPSLLAEPPNDVARLTFMAQGAEGEMLVDVDTVVRRIDGAVVGFGGIVNQTSSPVGEVERTAVDTSAMIPSLEELHRSLAILAEAGAFLNRHFEKMTPERIQQAGTSIRRQSNRLHVIVEEIDQVRRGLERADESSEDASA